MSRLLRANFSRLRHDVLFWLLAIFMPLIAVLGFSQMGIPSEGESILRGPVFVASALIWFVVAIFCASFDGAEYSNGAIRNKIVAGHSRATIYLSMLLTDFIVALILLLLYIAPYLIIGSVIGYSIDLLSLAMFIAISAAVCAGAVFLFHMLMTLLPKGILACFIAAVVIFLTSALIWSALNEPEMIEDYEFTEDGGLRITGQEPNPSYISGTQRNIYEFLMYALPTGQALLIGEGTIDPVMLTYMGTWCAIIVVAGMWIYSRKNLN